MKEIRVPLYGMVQLTDLEWEIVNSGPFQRLRRIKQLAFSDFIYPGAVHTRFEHSLGVMHLATQAFDRITAKRSVGELLLSDGGLGYDQRGTTLERARRMVRLGALTHDLGHLPFSHAAEGVLPTQDGRKPYKHEAYSYAIIRHYLQGIMESHRENQDLVITSDEIADFLEGRTRNTRMAALAPWRALIDGELDCDRMDYLRRDSHHLGVQYGTFDVDRVLSTLTLVQNPDTGAVTIGVEQGGLLAIESLILARYYMFQQVYFHKVRRYLDLQYGALMRTLVQDDPIAPPTETEGLDDYLDRDDWTVQAQILECAKNGTPAAQRIAHRRCAKVGYEVNDPKDFARLIDAAGVLRTKGVDYLLDDGADTYVQKFKTSNIQVLGETGFDGLRPITECSQVAVNIPDTIFIGRLYVSGEDRERIKREGWLEALARPGGGVEGE